MRLQNIQKVVVKKPENLRTYDPWIYVLCGDTGTEVRYDSRVKM